MAALLCGYFLKIKINLGKKKIDRGKKSDYNCNSVIKNKILL